MNVAEFNRFADLLTTNRTLNIAALTSNLQSGQGSYYRAMALTVDELKAVMRNGMTADRSEYHTVFLAADPKEAVQYMYASSEVFRKKGADTLLAVIFQVDASRVRAEESTTYLEASAVPADAISGVFVYDKKQGLVGKRLVRLTGK